MGSAAVYGILNTGTEIQAKTDTIKIPDYSAKLDSLNSQVNSLNSQIGSINNNIPDLSTLKTNLADIHEKLADLDNMKTDIANMQKKLDDLGSNQVQQVSSSTGIITVTLDKTVYLPGDTMHIRATGADLLKAVQIQLLDNNGYTLTSQSTWADSAGNVSYDMNLSSSLFPGSYQIKLISNQATGYRQFTINTSNATPNGSYTFTAQTDKAIYQTGDMIQITGVSQPSSVITAVMSSLSGKTFTTSTTANADGTYTILFSTLSSFETGTWGITLTSLGQTKTVSVYIDSGGSSGSYTFTAKTDKTSYNQGESVQVYGIVQPNTSVSAVMTNPSGSTYSSSTTANSAGSYTMSFSTLSSYQTGTWTVSVSNSGQSKTLYFTLGTSSGYAFTAQTDKPTYHRGDLIQISGYAQAGSSIVASLVSPTGNAYPSSTTANSYGSYVMFFSTPSSYETGNWYADVTNLGQHKILSFTLQPAS